MTIMSLMHFTKNEPRIFSADGESSKKMNNILTII